ncbi:Tat pathway signal sequence domain protein [Streptomyces vinaceus]
MEDEHLGRRGFNRLLVGCALAGVTVLNAGCGSARPAPTPSGSLEDAVGRAYSFLDRRTDEAADGGRAGLPRSYSGGHMDRNSSQAAFTYDVALMIIAYCARGERGDRDRAGGLAGALMAAQGQDPARDGRLRQSYVSGALTRGRSAPEPAAAGTFTGTLAWVGLAFLHAFRATGDDRLRDAAVRAGRWIQDTVHHDNGIAGYAGGFTDRGEELPWRSSEHHCDLAGFFSQLARFTGDPVWSERAGGARAFLAAMWDAGRGAYWTGTGTDGRSVNRSPVPEDPQTWSYLATRDDLYAASVDWARQRLAAEDGGFTGVSVSDADTSKVWFEGTAHLVCALHARNRSGDLERAQSLLRSLRAAQAHAPNTDGRGLVAASSDGLSTGGGDTLYASPHTGTTAWFILAAQGVNPFVVR